MNIANLFLKLGFTEGARQGLNLKILPTKDVLGERVNVFKEQYLDLVLGKGGQLSILCHNGADYKLKSLNGT